MTWTPEQLARIDAERELEIAAFRADGTSRPATPVWVVRASNDVYVRSWYRRTGGWFGDAVRSRRAHVRVPGVVDADVRIDDVGAGSPELRAVVDQAYRDKYGSASSGEMVGDRAAATTLRLLPD